MMKSMRRATSLLLVAALLMVPITAPAIEMASYDVSDGSIVGDFLICRPVGMAATLVGSAIFVLSLPFSALGDNVGQCAQLLVVDPAKFTFDRPLGKFK